MKDEPFFIVNDFTDNNKRELENIINTTKPEHYKKLKKAVFLRNFTNALFKSYRKNKTPEHIEKYNLLKKKEALLKKLQELEKK
ncbi:MAG TPA: hypothetical protein VJI68_02680 [Candidatus Nanoarchaeia archaeon]|nr:hypothetical protein [Candidatus Nanoarchaeia archaeon]